MAITDGKALHRALETADGDPDAVAQIFNSQRREDIRHQQHLQMARAVVPIDGRRCCSVQVLSSFGVELPQKYRVLRSLAKIHTIFCTLGHLIAPWLIPMQVAHRFQYELVTAKQALNILKRDALILASTTAITFSSRYEACHI